jgi:hypothetical protein
VRPRTLICAGIAISSLVVGLSSSASAEPARATTPDPRPAAAGRVDPAGLTGPVAPPKLIPPMKKLPKGSTAKDFQRALDAYAAQTGQTYSVDAGTVHAAAGAEPKAAAADPDVPPIFNYLTPSQCVGLGGGSYWRYDSTGVGRIYNHYQWCAWSLLKLQVKETINNREYVTGELTYRMTVIGWGSKSVNETLVRIYIDQVNADNGGKLTPGNASLTVNTSCDFVYNPTNCSTSPASGQTATFLDFANGKVLEFTTTTALPPEGDPDNLDRKVGMNLNVHFLASNTLQPGKIVDFGTLKPVVRCDGAGVNRGGFSGAACIFGGVVPQWTLSKSDPVVDEVAQHIYDAINNPNSTSPPDPSGHKIIPPNLTRTIDGNLNDAQRRKAVYQCSKWFPKQSDESCDEYPFASTYEGTFNDPETNYSVKYITAKKNTDEGRLRGTWYIYDRILELDGFKVVAY